MDLGQAAMWLEYIVLAGISGAVGQGARVIIGIKKINDQATATNQSVADLIQPSRLVVSLLIGFVAGVLAALAMKAAGTVTLEASTILGFAAAGYTGADFIEGIMNGYTPATGAGASVAPAQSNGAVG